MNVSCLSAAYAVAASAEAHLPLVLDVPHACRFAPPNVRLTAPDLALLRGWDAYVDELFAHAPLAGAGLISARFPRWMVDVNRARDDIDVGVIHGDWPGRAYPSQKSRVGRGVFWRYAMPGVNVHRRAIPVATAQGWLTDFYDSYHRELCQRLDDGYREHAGIWHINCHSIKSSGLFPNAGNGQGPVDFIVSNMDGQTSSPDFLDLPVELLKARGFNVQVNNSFKSAHLINAYSDPLSNRHSIQIGVNRSLYLDERTFDKSDDFLALQATLAGVIDEIAAYVRKIL